MRVLSEKQKDGFRRYKYACIDSSPLSKYVMQPFWNWFVARLPLWLAPNLMTFIGFLLELFNFFLIAYYDWDFQQLPSEPVNTSRIPRTVWLVVGIIHFIAHTLDGSDGKQARRTGSSTPLGELFDHGLDSMAVWLMVSAVVSALGVGRNLRSLYYVVTGITFGFFCTHWEKYNTGVLFLPWSYDLTQLLIVGIYFITYAYGVVVWSTPLGNMAPASALMQFSVLDIFESLTWVGIAAQPLQSVYLVYMTGRRPVRMDRLVKPMIPFIILFGGFTLWLNFSPTDAILRNIRVSIIVIGMIFSNLSSRLIVDQMADNDHTVYNWLLVAPLPFCIIAGVYLGFSEELLLWSYLCLVVVSHVRYGVNVVKDLCDYLNVHCFKINLKIAYKMAKANGY